MKRFVAALFLTGGLLFVGEASAAAVFTIEEVGANLRVTASGTLITNGLTFSSASTSLYSILLASFPFITVGPDISNPVNYDSYTGQITGPSPIGNANFLSATSTTSPNSIVGFDKSQNAVYTPVGFQSGSTISGSSTFAGESFASVGLTDGSTYTYTLANNETITVIIGSPPAPSAVPSLSEWTQLLLAFMAITLVGWHFHRERSH